MTKHTIITGDARKMSDLADESVQLVVTSPPYWQLKDYGSEQQIGFHDTYETYINHLNLVWAECHRVLHSGCRLCINIGEQFARSVYYGRYKIIAIHSEIIRFCETIGFDFMGAVIWQKTTTMNSTGGGAVMGSFPNPRNGILKLDYEYILLFKKQGDGPKISPEQKRQSEMTKEEWNTFFAGHWNFVGARQENHLAMFPEELPRRLIKMFSFVGETVLDPFLGSGTTALAAKNLERNSVGLEINPDFIPFIKEKLGVGVGLFQAEAEFVFKNETVQPTDFEAAIQKLPYQFIDPHTLDKRVDVKKRQFGSRLDAAEKPATEEFFQVKKVWSAEKVELNNGLVVRLLGIREDPTKNGHAVDFIIQKTRGQKVFLKYDAEKFDADNVLQGYLYLQNKTFINAHLLKAQLVSVNESIEFKYKTRFNEYLHAATN